MVGKQNVGGHFNLGFGEKFTTCFKLKLSGVLSKLAVQSFSGA
jgi:hypothetical protein